MVNRTSEAAGKLLELSLKLNKYIGEYQGQAVLIRNLLARDDEESVFKIEDVLNHRETLIKSYDQTAMEFKREQSLCSDDSVIPPEIRQKLDSLEQERQAIFMTIRDTETDSLKKISQMYTDNRGHIKQIEEGKKLLNAYQSAPQVTDGVFFDRRK